MSACMGRAYIYVLPAHNALELTSCRSWWQSNVKTRSRCSRCRNCNRLARRKRGRWRTYANPCTPMQAITNFPMRPEARRAGLGRRLVPGSVVSRRGDGWRWERARWPRSRKVLEHSQIRYVFSLRRVMPALDETLLDEELAELEKLRVWSPRVISKLENFIRSDDDWALFRANPFYFAEERGVAEEEAVELFLLASKVGLFQMTWSLLCPGCGDAVQSFATLKSICSTFHCYLCRTDTETCLDDFVHVGFTISPKIRPIAAHDPASLGIEDFYYRYHFTRETHIESGGRPFVDYLKEHVRGLSYLEPRSMTSFDVEIEPGIMLAYDMITHHQFGFEISAENGESNAPLHLRLQDGEAGAPVRSIRAGKMRLEIANDSDERNSVVLLVRSEAELRATRENAASGAMTFDRFLSGRRLLTCPTFREMFGAETIRSSDGIGVRDISILFTDLKGSTAMYDRIGDLKAFTLVNQHFGRLERAIHRHHGAVVKTIGDAVMASFERPNEAVLAARDMLREIERFNREVGEDAIILKVGVHRGASIAVTLNNRLDFFGQTVNIASRVQGLADADEIYVTEDVYREPGVRELLSELHVTPREANLRGVQRAVRVYRIATTAPESGETRGE